MDPVSYTHLDVYKRQTLTRGFPRGIDAEVINFSVLEKAYEKMCIRDRL